MPIYVVNNDIIFADTFKLPRLAFGPFTYVLQGMYKKLHDQALDIQYYGKPTLNTSLYTS